MSTRTRRARVEAFAKLNLGLRILDLRPDGYHELRTVFQTVSLADTLDLAFTPARSRSVSVTANVPIEGPNLVQRAATLALEAMHAAGTVEIRLTKRIPIGAGLGGGSSDAAAVLLALPALAGKRLSLPARIELASCLGSDVPFFLLGGTAVALGRGTELYPLPDAPSSYGLIATPGVHVSTREAYAALDRARDLTSPSAQSMISGFQSSVWEQGGASVTTLGGNDFEPVVFRQHPRLKSLKTRLERLGAAPAMLSGSGSALFGVFRGRAERDRARESFGKEQVFPIRFVSRAEYHRRWLRFLATHVAERLWPPQSRYA